MPRTPEQVAADDALTEAINRCREAYFPSQSDSPAGVLLDFVVIGAERYYGDDGEAYTPIFTLYRDGDVPAYIAVGLAETALFDWRTERARHT